MVRRLFFVLLLFILTDPLCPKLSMAAVINANSCSYTDVNSAIGSASPGDTVYLPACGLVGSPIVWSSGPITVNGIYVIGAGTRDNPQTFLKAGNEQSMFTVVNHPTYNTRLSGISIQVTWSQAYPTPRYFFEVNGSYSNNRVRIDNMNLIQTGNTYQNSGIQVTSGLVLIDHCKFTNIFLSAIYISYGQSNSWSSPSTMGNVSEANQWNHFSEDNIFIYNNEAPGFPDLHGPNAYDLYRGARLVSRYNSMVNTTWVNHGHPAEPMHGGRHIEEYNDAFTCNKYGADYCPNIAKYIWIRDGTGVITNTSFEGRGGGYSASSIHMSCEESDCNYGACCNSYPCAGCPGRGQYGTTSEPIYIWNITDKTTYGLGVGGIKCSPSQCAYDSYYMIQEGRDYIVGTAKPGWAPYTYPHPLTKNAVLRPPVDLRIIY